MPVGTHDLPRLAGCLAAVGQQHGRVDEVLLVVTAEGPDAEEVVAEQSRDSWRVRVLPLPGASRAAAVTEGVRSAAGSLVLVCDVADELAEGAVPAATGTVEETGADLVGATEADLGRARLADLVFRKSLWEHGPGSVDEAPQGEWVAAARLVLAATVVREGRWHAGAARTPGRSASGHCRGWHPMPPRGGRTCRTCSAAWSGFRQPASRSWSGCWTWSSAATSRTRSARPTRAGRC